jgi:uncharacterized protein (TIGR00369 family)
VVTTTDWLSRECRLAPCGNLRLVTNAQERPNRVEREQRVSLDFGHNFLSEFGITEVAVEGADLAIEMRVSPRVCNKRGSLQGGMIATLIDIVAGRLTMAGIEDGYSGATNDMNIHFLAPIVEGPARAEGRVLRRGQRSVVVQVDVLDVATNRLAAVSIVSFAVLSPR